MFFRPLILCVFLAAGGAAAWAEGAPENAPENVPENSLKREGCAVRYARIVTGWAKAAPGRFVRFQKEYWPEVWRTRGGRLLFAPRDNPGKINWIYLIDDPVSEGLRLKYRMSVPLSMAAWGGLGYWLDTEADDNRLKFALGSEEFSPAAPVLLQYYQLGLIDSQELVSDIKKAHRELDEFLVNPKPGARHPRFPEFRKMGLIESDEEEQELVRLARETYLATEEKNASGASFVNRFYDSFLDAVSRHPGFRAKSDRDLQLLLFLFVPARKFEGTRDMELARRALDGGEPETAAIPSVAAELGLPAAMAVAAATKEESERNRAKRLVEGRRIGMPEERLGTLRRASIPHYQQPIEFETLQGKKVRLESELARWEAILGDPRFMGLAEQWKQGKVSDVAALAQHEAWMRGLEEIYRRGDSPSPQDLCEQFEKKNPALVPALLVTEAVKKQKISPEQLRYCRFEVGRFYWQSHLRQAEIPRDAAWLEAEAQRLEALVVERCLGAPVKNPEAYRCGSESTSGSTRAPGGSTRAGPEAPR